MSRKKHAFLANIFLIIMSIKKQQIKQNLSKVFKTNNYALFLTIYLLKNNKYQLLLAMHFVSLLTRVI